MYSKVSGYLTDCIYVDEGRELEWAKGSQLSFSLSCLAQIYLVSILLLYPSIPSITGLQRCQDCKGPLLLTHRKKKNRLLKREPNPTSMSAFILHELITNAMPDNPEQSGSTQDHRSMLPWEIKITKIKLDECPLANPSGRGLAHFQVADFILLLENNLYGREFFFPWKQHSLSGKPGMCWIPAVRQSR